MTDAFLIIHGAEIIMAMVKISVVKMIFLDVVAGAKTKAGMTAATRDNAAFPVRASKPNNIPHPTAVFFEGWYASCRMHQMTPNMRGVIKFYFKIYTAYTPVGKYSAKIPAAVSRPIFPAPAFLATR